MLRRLKAEGRTLAAYGAAAKGSTLLNYFGIGRDVLDFVVDRSTYKQGRFMPGVRLPIYSPERLLEARPDYVLLLTWNFAKEILEQQAEYRARGGRFVIPWRAPRPPAPPRRRGQPAGASSSRTRRRYRPYALFASSSARRASCARGMNPMR
jgi:hypothetical protein